MRATLLLARRLTLNPEKGKSISPGVTIGYIGVSLSIIIMLLSVAIVNGFKKQITQKLIEFNAPISLIATGDNIDATYTQGIKANNKLLSLLKEQIPQAQITKTVRQPAIFKTDSEFQGVMLKGIDNDAQQWQYIASNLIDGTIPPHTPDHESKIIISSATASRLGLKTGDKIDTHFLQNDNVRTRRLQISGIYNSHFKDFDETQAFTHISLLQKLNKVDSTTCTSIEFTNIPIQQADNIATSLRNTLQLRWPQLSEELPKFSVTTITDTCGNYLSWLELLNTNVVVILILMSCVAIFTLISSLFIIVLARVNTIGLLKAIGATNTQIRSIFIYMAQRIVLKALIIGNLITITLCLLQNKFHLLKLDADAYYLSYVPVNLTWQTLLIVNIIAIALSAIVLIAPSHIIASLKPNTTLRFE